MDSMQLVSQATQLFEFYGEFLKHPLNYVVVHSTAILRPSGVNYEISFWGPAVSFIAALLPLPPKRFSSLCDVILLSK